MKHILLLLLGCLCGMHTAFGFAYRAVAVDSVGEGLPYATYRIFGSDSLKAIISDTSDEQGKISGSLASEGDYRMVVTYVGMADAERRFVVNASSPDANLGNIALQDEATVLKGVTVTAQKPLVVKKIDRLAYDVQADPEMPVAKVNDILRKVPTVSVDADGTIRVNGSTNFKIYKNGRPNNSMSKNAKELFKAMPASMIKRIEVITDPGAEFDAEGTSAVLNIVTAENTSIKGVLGNIDINFTQANKYPQTNLWLNTEIDKVNLSLNGGFVPINGRMTHSMVDGITDYSTGNRLESHTDNRSKGEMTWFGLDGSWQLDSLNLFSAETMGYYFNAKTNSKSVSSMFDRNQALIGAFEAQSYMPANHYFDVNANVNYQHSFRRPGETLTFSYLLSNTDQLSENQTDYLSASGVLAAPYSAQYRKFDLHFIEHTFQLDWNRPVGKIHMLNFGAKAILRRNHSTNHDDYTGVGENFDEFSHITNIGALYGQYTARIGKVNLRGGLRWEYSHLSAKYPLGNGKPFSANLNDLVPSASASWQISDANSLTANYSSSINRPGIEYLNPAVQLSPTTESYGNSDLKSARRQSVKLTFMRIKQKYNFNVSANYAQINNGIAQVNFLNDQQLMTTTYANSGHMRSMGFSAYAQYSPFSKTTLMLNATLDKKWYKQYGISLSRWLPSVYVNISQKLPWKIDASVYCYWYGGSLDDVYSYTTKDGYDSVNLSIMIKRAFLKEDRLTVGLFAGNIFGSNYKNFTTHRVNGDYTGTTVTRSGYGNLLGIQVGYRFGNLRSQVKKINAIRNDDLVGKGH